jgi:hypothetical protein
VRCHCEELSDGAIHGAGRAGLLRFARNDDRSWRPVLTATMGPKDGCPRLRYAASSAFLA